LRRDQRLAARLDGASVGGVDVVHVQVEQLRRGRAGALRRLRDGAVRPLGREHQDQFAAICHFDMQEHAIVVVRVPRRETERVLIERGGRVRVAYAQVWRQPWHIGRARVGHVFSWKAQSRANAPDAWRRGLCQNGVRVRPAFIR
jgi:hypothetical protein